MPQDVLLLGAPALICVCAGIVLVRRRAWWGIRLIGLALALVNLVPGIAWLVSPLPDPVAWLGIVATAVGVILLLMVAARWRQPDSWPPPPLG